MDVTLPKGVAMNSGTPPAGGVSDVLAQPAGTPARDSFAALLAADGDGAAGASTAGDGEGDTDLAQDPSLAALAAGVLCILPLPATPPIVVTTGGAGDGAATTVVPAGEDLAAAAGTTPAGNATASAVEAALRDQAASAEAGEAAPRPSRRAGVADAPAGASTAKDAAGTDSAARTIVAVSGAAADAEAHARGGGQPQAPTTGSGAVHAPSDRPRETVPFEAVPDSQASSARIDAAALSAGEPTTAPRHREALPSRPEISSDVRHPTGAESLSSAPRAAENPPPAAPSNAAAAYRHEPPTLPDTSRPLGRLPEGGEMRLEVSPEGLGPIEIRVAVRADAVQASLWTQQDHARAALEAHRPMLADALGRSSLRLEEFTVGVGQHHHPAQDDDGAPRRWANPAAAEPVAAPTPTYAPARPRGLSLRA